MQQAYKTAKILSAVTAVAIYGTMAQAAPVQISWSNTAASSDFESGPNWTGGSAPADNLTTNTAGFTTAVGMTQPSLTKDRSIAGLSIGNTAGTALVLGGSSYTLTVGTSGITQTTTGGSSGVINPNVTVSGVQNWSIRSTLNLNGVLGGSSSITLTAPGYLQLNGTSANTYNGTMGLNTANGRLYLNKTAGQNALAGDLAVTNGTVSWLADDQIADTSNISMAAGALNFYKALTGSTGISSETFNNLSVSGGTVYTDGANGLGGTQAGLIQNNNTIVTGGILNISGGTQWSANSVAVSGGGVVNRIGTSYAGTERALTIGAGGLSITNQAAGAYTPINIGSSLSGKATNKLVLQGDVSFTGFAGNSNTTTIGGDTTNPVRGTIELNGTRTFTVADGDAAVDLRVVPAMNNNGATAGGLTKAGAGTLELAGTNLYSGDTNVSAGTLIVTGSIANSNLVVGNDGTIVPGGANNILAMSVAGLDVSGINDTGRLAFDLGASGVNDQISAVGALSLGTLNFSDFAFNPTAALQNGDTFTLLHGGSLTGSIGTASGLLGTGTTGTLSLSGNDVILTVAVPEPTTVGLFGLVVSLGLMRRQRRAMA